LTPLGGQANVLNSPPYASEQAQGLKDIGPTTLYGEDFPIVFETAFSGSGFGESTCTFIANVAHSIIKPYFSWLPSIVVQAQKIS